jgi:putative ABC transport system permease protein
MVRGRLHELWLRIKALRHRDALERDLDDELAYHLEMRARKNRQAGMDAEEARYAAKRTLGNVTRLKEVSREMWTFAALESFWQDVRYGARTLRKSPGFTIVAVLTLALGIGANTAIFSVVQAVLLRPLPFRDPGRLVLLTEYKAGKVDQAGVPYPDYLEWKKRNTVFEETAAYFDIEASNDMVLGSAAPAERVEYSIVTSSFLPILGIRPALGRAFRDDEDRPGGGKAFLASDELWRRSFGADPEAIGKSFLLDGDRYTLVGVMPAGFQFPLGRDVWISVGSLSLREQQDRISHPYRVLGRLRPGVDLHAAQAQIDGIAQQLGKIYPTTNATWRVRAVPLLDEFVGKVRPSLLVLLGAVFFIFLIACTNVVNLMLARACTLEHEFAIRSAVGAGRARLLRQSLTESLLIVVLSVVGALLLAEWGVAGIVSLTSIQVPRLESFRWNAEVLAFTIVIAAVTTLLVGSVPAIHAFSGDVQQALREGQKSSSAGTRSQRIRNILVVSEMALAMVLLSAAGLMLRSFLRLNRVDPGFDSRDLVTMKIALPGSQYTTADQTARFLDQLLARLWSVPGFEAASATTTFPLRGESNWGTFNIVGRPLADWSQAPSAEGRGISADYFRTMGIALLRGREFREHDAQEISQVAIINEAMAKKFFPGTDPIGQHLINQDESPRTREIIGIVADTKSFGLSAQSPPEIYTLYHAWWYTNLVLRTKQPLATVVSAVREQVSTLDKGVAVYQMSTVDDLLARSKTPQRFNLTMLAVFASLALGLATVGIYGLLAFGVARRTGEIGIRMALGAEPRSIHSLIVWQGMRLTLLGLGIGVAVSFALTRLMAGLLFGVKPTDPLTSVAVSVLLILVALWACYIPARRAMRIDPIVALRCE